MKSFLNVEIFFLLAMLLGQFVVIANGNAVDVLAGLITTRALIVLIGMRYAKQERKTRIQ